MFVTSNNSIIIKKKQGTHVEDKETTPKRLSRVFVLRHSGRRIAIGGDWRFLVVIIVEKILLSY